MLPLKYLEKKQTIIFKACHKSSYGKAVVYAEGK